jgi:chromate reductase
MKEGMFDAAGNMAGDSKEFLQKWLDRYMEWVKRHTA